MEPFDVTIRENDTEVLLTIVPETENKNKGRTLFHILSGDIEICTIMMKENGAWEWESCGDGTLSELEFNLLTEAIEAKL